MGAIAKHKTPVSTAGSWDGAKAIIEAKNDAATLRHMHAWVNESEDGSQKTSYKFAHHAPGTDTPAVLSAVNQALVRLYQSEISPKDKAMVEAHLRAHRRDAGLDAVMSEAEIAKTVKHIKDVDDLKRAEAEALIESIRLQEKSNLAEWLESRLHLTLTQIADDMFGDGRVTRTERKVLSGAIGAALDSYHQFLEDNGPQLFARRPWDEAPEEDGEQPITETMREVLLEESAIALQEKAVRGDGTVPIKIIQPGWGSSGYYPKEVLQRDGAKAFKKGTKMLWNHPTSVEEAERPEGNLNDLASELVSDARWMEQGPKGPGLYADAKVFEAYQEPVNDLAPHIGVSIHARGKGVYGEAEGKQGVIVQEILESPFNRVDYVTMPGAGGEIISLFEAARTVRVDTTNAGAVPVVEATNSASTLLSTSVAKSKSKTEEEMADEKLQEAVATLRSDLDQANANNARLSEALVLRDARDMVKEALDGVVHLPEITKKRLSETLSLNPPMKDGALDRAAFKTTIEETVKAEVQYLETVLGKGQIRGLGESQDVEEEGTKGKVEESLEASFSALGLSETAAKHAARGRK